MPDIQSEIDRLTATGEGHSIPPFHVRTAGEKFIVCCESQIDDGWQIVAEMYQVDGQRMAWNALLFAAAPELLECCIEAYRDGVQTGQIRARTTDAMLKAITKALTMPVEESEAV